MGSVPAPDNAHPSKLGRYELITQIGQGGMAEVLLALQRGPAGFEKLVVVKLVHKNLAKQKTFVDMLLDEARVAALVKHPNVVDIYDLGEAEGRYFIAMEYLEGEPLLGLLRAGRDGNRLDPLSTARLVADTAGGLDAAHELRSLAGERMELVHHDVSLGNIVVLYNGQVKLVDFGVAKASQNAGPQMKVHGKFGYMAPEKLRAGGGDRRSDIWSLGVVLWEALTLRRLFRGATENETMRMVLTLDIQRPSTINPESPPELDPIVMRALERDPVFRYATAKELARDIEEVLRRNAYGGRNDVIADYMQFTFATHIAARQRLLQEVSTKGRASAEVLEAAFAEPDPDHHDSRAAPRPSGEFSIAFRRPTLETPTHGVQRSAVADHGLLSTRPARPSAAPALSPDEIIERRRFDDMIAEGTPSVVTSLPKQLFAEATPIIPESEISLDRRTTANEPPAELELLPLGAPAPDGNRTEVDLADILEAPIDTTPKLDDEARREIEIVRAASLKRAIADVLDRFEEPPDEPAPAAILEAPLVPERPSSQRLRPPSLKPATRLVFADGGSTRVEKPARGVSPIIAAALIGSVALVFIILLMLR
jgi:serine/threonine-protein kinase